MTPREKTVSIRKLTGCVISQVPMREKAQSRTPQVMYGAQSEDRNPIELSSIRVEASQSWMRYSACITKDGREW